jgi:hypothetical protein
MNIFKLNKKLVFIIYTVLDTFLVGMGMGIPIFSILLGFPVGGYISKRISKSERYLKDILGVILKYSFLTSLVTFLWMIVIWVPISTMLLNPTADFTHFGIPMILYNPKISFIGWIILMVFISPFLQLLITVFTAQVTLWGILNKKNERVR